MWKLIKQSLISHLIVVIIGATSASGAAYLAIRDRLNNHEHRIAYQERTVDRLETTVRKHHEKAAGEEEKLSSLCLRLSKIEEKIDKLLLKTWR
jgi:uncharacterized coiled-coil protein SlyX